MRPPITNRDPGDEPQLFDPRTTEMPKCPSCGTTAKNACEHEADIAAGIRDPYARRPRGCLVSFQLDPDEPWPKEWF